MKAADFIYHRPASLQEALALLSDYDGTARILAGGQSLIPMLNMRLWRPPALIDIADLTDLERIEPHAAGTILGAAVRHIQVLTDLRVADRLPLLPKMMRYVGDPQVRNRGTLGGSLVQADPTGEMPLAALTLGAVVHAVGPRGRRAIPIEELYLGAYATSLDPLEILTEVHYPVHPGHCAFVEVSRRHNDFAVVSVAVAADLGPDGAWRNVSIGLGGVDETPVLARSAMANVEGTEIAAEDARRAGEAAAATINPASDVRASADYRRHLTAVHVKRALIALRDGDGTGRERALS